MLQNLLHKSFRRNRKGLASLISVIFMVLIVFFLGSNVFMYALNQNASFQDSVSLANQKELDCANEELKAFNATYNVIGSKVWLEAQITNYGSVSVQVLTLWTMDTTTQKYGFNDTLNISLKSGESVSLSGVSALSVTVEGCSLSDDFTSWFVTDRGNRIQLEPMEEPKSIIVAQIAQGIGSMALDLTKFRYFNYTSEALSNYPDGVISFNILKNSYVAFGCYLTNLDPSMQTIVIDSHSLFWQPGRPSVSEGVWFIVNVNSNGSISGTYSNITINYGETRMLVFASQNDLSLGAFSKAKTPNVVDSVATFLLLHGKIGSAAYAQNIPFVSLFYT